MLSILKWISNPPLPVCTVKPGNMPSENVIVICLPYLTINKQQMPYNFTRISPIKKGDLSMPTIGDLTF